MLFKCKTRYRILKEAFGLCADSKSAHFSLSELASRVNISKPAIFRHFKNKEALLKEMTNMFWSDFSELFEDKEYFFMKENFSGCNFEEFYEIESKIYDLFVQNKGYLDYFANLVLTDFSMQTSAFDKLLKKQIKFSESFVENFSNKIFFKIYFCNIGIIHFVCVRESLLEKNELPESYFEKYKDNAIKFLWNGLGNKKIQLEKERIIELQENVNLQIDQFFGKNKFFKAFTEVVDEYGINGVTIEKICDKLKIANSSFYSYYNNKEDFISSMISEEVESFMKVFFEKTKFAKNIDELIYILLHVEQNYLDMNPAALSLHGWIIKNNVSKSKIKIDHGYTIAKMIEQLEDAKISLNIDMDWRLFLGLIISASAFLKVFFENSKNNYICEVTDYADELFELIECGIKNSMESV